MNLSGRSVAPAMNFYKIEPEDVYVVYDDIDMPSGKVKTKKVVDTEDTTASGLS